MIKTALIRVNQPVAYSSSAQLNIYTAFRPRANTAFVVLARGQKNGIGSGLQSYFRSDISSILGQLKSHLWGCYRKSRDREWRQSSGSCATFSRVFFLTLVVVQIVPLRMTGSTKATGWIVKWYGQYGKKGKSNSEKIWKIQKKIVKWYGKYGRK